MWRREVYPTKVGVVRRHVAPKVVAKIARHKLGIAISLFILIPFAAEKRNLFRRSESVNVDAAEDLILRYRADISLLLYLGDKPSSNDAL